MGGEGLLQELTPIAAQLLERHLAASRTWFPHELVPWSRGRDFQPGETVDEADSGVAPGVRAALVLSVLTEDNLPFYVVALDRQFGRDDAWRGWTCRWAAEEARHSTAIRDYLAVTRMVDPAALERTRLAGMSQGWTWPLDEPLPALVYLALQESATQLAHANLGRALEPAGRRLFAHIAADENLHFRFYRDLVVAALEADPDATVAAIDARVRTFAMPGAGAPWFAERARLAAAEGIASLGTLHGQVIVPLVERYWRLRSLEGLSSDGARARDRVLAFVERLGRIAGRWSAATAAAVDAAPAPGGSS